MQYITMGLMLVAYYYYLIKRFGFESSIKGTILGLITSGSVVVIAEVSYKILI